MVNPESRLSITDILERLAAVCESYGYDLKEPFYLEGKDVYSARNPSPGI